MTPESTDPTAGAPNLIGLEPERLRRVLSDHFEERGEPSYRVDQAVHWIEDELAPELDAMTTLPARERRVLGERFEWTELAPHTVARSEDGTVKHLWELDDGERVESVLIPSGDRLTLCLSSQAGCPMGCTFCATGWSGFARQLTAAEIVAQYRGAQRWARDHDDGRISNVVYMGMGEPMANRKAVFPSLTILNRGYGLGARHITVSTVGVVPGILELADRPEQFTLAVSLHAARSELREKLIPLERRWPLPEVIEALKTYRLRAHRRVTFEYTMIRGVNDDPAEAERLADLAREVGAFVNLIPFNPIPYREWEPSTAERIGHFEATLRKRDVAVEVRTPRGREIDAACGQLRARAREGGEGPSNGSRRRSAPSEPPGPRERAGESPARS